MIPVALSVRFTRAHDSLVSSSLFGGVSVGGGEVGGSVSVGGEVGGEDLFEDPLPPLPLPLPPEELVGVHWATYVISLVTVFVIVGVQPVKV